MHSIFNWQQSRIGILLSLIKVAEIVGCVDVDEISQNLQSSRPH